MCNRFQLNVFFLSLFSFLVWCGSCGFSDLLLANGSNLLELAKKHDDQWQIIDSAQLSYTKNYAADGKNVSLGGCYWESNGTLHRSIMVQHDDNKKLCEDTFYDGEDFYTLTVPRNKYPVSNIQLCDYVALKEEGYRARLTPREMASIGSDIRLRFPLPRYFFVPTEEKLVTLLELVNKYPSNVVSAQKNATGDDVIEIALEGRSENNSNFGPWKLKVSLNTSKGYCIGGYWFSTTAQQKPSIEMISECVVKKYVCIGGTYWIPSEWVGIQHNGNPAVGSRMTYIIDDCKINAPSASRLADFCFPTNFPVFEFVSTSQPEKIHIWGADNKPIQTFANHIEFADYYADECVAGKGQPKENKYLALRISLMVLGLIMIAYALYRLYAKER